MIGSCLFFVFIELIYLLSHWFSYGENRLVKMDSVIFFLVFQANLMHFWPLFHIMATEEHWPEMGERPLELQLIYFSFQHTCVNMRIITVPYKNYIKRIRGYFQKLPSYVFYKKLFLNNLAIFTENTRVGVSFW